MVLVRLLLSQLGTSICENFCVSLPKINIKLEAYKK